VSAIGIKFNNSSKKPWHATRYIFPVQRKPISHHEYVSKNVYPTQKHIYKYMRYVTLHRYELKSNMVSSRFVLNSYQIDSG